MAASSPDEVKMAEESEKEGPVLGLGVAESTVALREGEQGMEAALKAVESSF